MENLLEKTRTLNRLLQRNQERAVEYAEMVTVLGDILDANVYFISRSGSLLSYALTDGRDCQAPEMPDRTHMHSMASENGTHTMSARENPVKNGLRRCPLADRDCEYTDAKVTKVPIVMSSQHQGELVIVRFGVVGISLEDTIIAEYGAMILGLRIVQSVADGLLDEARKKEAVKMVVSTLTYSEHRAAEDIFSEFTGREALVVASKIADRAGITRSVIVNTLRKLEGSGIVETKSLGMRGTKIKVLNEYIFETLGYGSKDS